MLASRQANTAFLHLARPSWRVENNLSVLDALDGSRSAGQAILAAAVEHRVLPQLLQTLKGASPTERRATRLCDELTSSLEPLVARWEDHRQRHLDGFEYALANGFGPAIGIKGVHYDALYDGGSFRQSSDVDVVLDGADFWTCVQSLVDSEYRMRIRFDLRPAMAGAESHVGVRGICEASRSVDGFAQEIDIHFGGFPSCGDNVVKLSRPSCEGLSFLPWLEEAVVQAAHTMRQGFIRLRELNDLWIMLDSGYFTSEEYLNALRPYHLDQVGGALLRLVSAHYPAYSSTASHVDRLSPLDKALLFQPLLRTNRMLDERQIVVTRYWQLRYLHNSDPSSSLGSDIKNLVHLFSNGRAYTITSTEPEKVSQCVDADHVTLRPIASTRKSYSTAEWLALLGIESGGFAVPRGADFHVADFNGQIVAFTGHLVLAVCSYSGGHEDLLDLSRKVVAKLRAADSDVEVASPAL